MRVGGWRSNLVPSSLPLLYPSQNSSSIHSSSAVPDFNFTINQQNKQTSGREGESGRGGWGGVRWYCRGVQRMRFSLWLSLYRQKELLWKPLRRNAEAADWCCGAQDYGWKHARARLCMSPSRYLRFGFPSPKTVSLDGRRISLC